MDNEADPSPSNHIDLPDLQETLFDEAQLRAYLDEVGARAEGLSVSVKQSSRTRPDGSDSLEGLADRLLSGAIFGAQLRYRFQASQWLDTLIGAGGAVKIVRMQVL